MIVFIMWFFGRGLSDVITPCTLNFPCLSTRLPIVSFTPHFSCPFTIAL
jgi:hypothetical protein